MNGILLYLQIDPWIKAEMVLGGVPLRTVKVILILLTLSGMLKEIVSFVILFHPMNCICIFFMPLNVIENLDFEKMNIF